MYARTLVLIQKRITHHDYAPNAYARSLEYTVHTKNHRVDSGKVFYHEVGAWSVAIDGGMAFALASAGVEGPGEVVASLASSARRATALHRVSSDTFGQPPTVDAQLPRELLRVQAEPRTR